jgi:myosin heavy subunit
VERVDAELAAFVRGTKCPQLAAAPAAAARPSHQRSVGAAFKCELAGLLSTISHTSLSFVRCIRPNGVQSPSEFDLELVTQQLACSGVEAALRVARLTYPRRATLEQFRADFACVAKLVPALPSQDLAVGKTLVFMSEKGWGVLRQAVRLLQQQAARRMQAAARRMMAKAEAQRLAQLQTWACVALQRAWRMATAKKSLANARRAAITVQASASTKRPR